MSAMLSNREEKLVAQLAETLAHHYPYPSVLDDAQVQVWRKELAQAQVPEADRIVARATALYEAKKQQQQEKGATHQGEPQKPATFQSFSLLDGLGSGGFALPPPPPEWDTVDPEIPPDQALTLFQEQVSHVEDVSLDWECVRPILAKSWKTSILQGNTSLRRSYLDLHSTWFKQCGRNNPVLQYDLCRHVTYAIRHSVYTASSNDHKDEIIRANDEFLFDLMREWHHMWTHARFSAHQAYHILYNMLPVLRQDMTTDGSRLSPCQSLALLDPSAGWFSKFTRTHPPDALVSLLVDTQWLASVCLYHQRHDGPTKKTSPTQARLQNKVRQHSLHMLQHALACARVAMFPWKAYGRSAPPPTPLDPAKLLVDDENQGASLGTPHHRATPSNPTNGQVGDMADAFISFLGSKEEVDGDILRMVGEATQTLLWGCCLSFPEGLGEVLSRLETCAEISTSWRLCLLRLLLDLLAAKEWSTQDVEYGILLDKTRELYKAVEPGDLAKLTCEHRTTIDTLVVPAQET